MKKGSTKGSVDTESWFYVPGSDEAQEALKRCLAKGTRVEDLSVEAVYFDTVPESLPLRAYVRTRRAQESGDGPEAWILEHRDTDASSSRAYPFPVRMDAAPEIAARHFHIAGLVPQFRLRHRREVWTVGSLTILLDTELETFSATAPSLRLGQDDLPRLSIAGDPDGSRAQERLLKVLRKLPRLPASAKRWVGYFHARNAWRLPMRNELPGWEYEVKLATQTLDVPLSSLPFPLLEVHQTHSIRRYYEDWRAGLRGIGDAVVMVRKGPKLYEDGVIKREETKSYDQSAWTLPEGLMEMRRFKRSVNLYNPETKRVYTLSLHHCVAEEEELLQVEIEYDGICNPDIAERLASFRATGDVSRLLALANDLYAEGAHREASELYRRFLRFAPEHRRAQKVKSRVADLDARAEDVETPELEVETLILDDLRQLRDALVELGLKPSRLTKRKWLRKIGAA